MGSPAWAVQAVQSAGHAVGAAVYEHSMTAQHSTASQHSITAQHSMTRSQQRRFTAGHQVIRTAGQQGSSAAGQQVSRSAAAHLEAVLAVLLPQQLWRPALPRRPLVHHPCQHHWLLGPLIQLYKHVCCHVLWAGGRQAGSGSWQRTCTSGCNANNMVAAMRCVRLDDARQQ